MDITQQYQEQQEGDAYRPRLEATTKSTEHLEDMTKSAMTLGVKAD